MLRKATALLCLALSLALCAGAAAETVSLDGVVAVKYTSEVYAPLGGTVEKVAVRAGQRVEEGDVIATIKTTKVYAPQSGTVTGVFGEVGDSVTDVTADYGAVLFIEGPYRYLISANTRNAYDTPANKTVHVGENVYIGALNDTDNQGEGVITRVTDAGYTVEVRSGTLEIGASYEIFRNKGRAASTRIGKGTVSGVNAEGVTGTGSIVSMAVKNGDKVERGQLLFETVDAEFEELGDVTTDIVATASGVMGQLNLTQGEAVTRDSVAAVIYPSDAMWIEATVNEGDLAYIQEGDPVTVSLNWKLDAEQTLPGSIAMISAVSQASDGVSTDASYTVYVDFTPESDTRYGMSAVVTAGE